MFKLYYRCPFLWNQVHPVIPVVFAYLFILAFASMLKTSWTDPGVVYKRKTCVKYANIYI